MVVVIYLGTNLLEAFHCHDNMTGKSNLVRVDKIARLFILVIVNSWVTQGGYPDKHQLEYTQKKKGQLQKSNIAILKDQSTTKSSLTTRIKEEVVIALYTAGLYLPKGRTSHPVLLIIKIFLPLVDMLTDWVNAGNG